MDLSKSEIKKMINVDYPIIIEIGGYDGRDTLGFLKEMPNAFVYVFECDPRSINLFESRVQSDKVKLEKMAVGNINGIATFHMSDSDTRRHYSDQNFWSASGSLKKPKNHLEIFPDIQFKHTVKVPCVKLDYWVDMEDLYVIDFLWMDVNGAEEDVILGGLNTLKKKTRYIYTEFSNKELHEGQITKDRILELLPEYEEIGVYNYLGNFGNVLLKNKTL